MLAYWLVMINYEYGASDFLCRISNRRIGDCDYNPLDYNL